MRTLAIFMLGMLPTLVMGQDDAKIEAPAKAVLCAACHGQTGVSTNPEWPNLAGQHLSYLQKQLRDFKAGKTRNAPTMTGMVASLTDEDINELAEFYASQPVPTDNKTPKEYLKRGEELYRGGDFTKKITACIACHGPNGTGNAQAGFPVLSGQHAPYTLLQLQAFKKHERKNDLNHIMQDISSRLDDDDMKALAYYVQGLY